MSKQNYKIPAICENGKDTPGNSGPTPKQLKQGISEDTPKVENPTDKAKELGFTGLSVQNFNTCLEESAKEPDPVRIFGPLLHEQELAVLFGGEKSGKSALAVQLADAYCRGEQIPGFENNAKPGTALFMDFELTAKQQEQRYKDDQADNPAKTLKKFSNNFDRAQVKAEDIQEDVFETLKKQIEVAAGQYNLIIVDNMSWLLHGQEKSDNAGELVKSLIQVKKDNRCAILLIAHTTKGLNKQNQRLNITDLAGSHTIPAFVDSVFGIAGNVNDSEIRYVKQCVSRSEPQIMGAEEVATLRFSKESNCLGFSFIRYEPEDNHIRTKEDEEEQQKENDIKDMLKEGYSIRDVVAKMGVGRKKVSKLSKEVKEGGEK